MQRKKSVAEELFGVAPKPARTGEHVVDPQKAVAPIKDTEAVIRVFCHGCGRYVPIIQEGVEALAIDAGEKLPDILSGSYFESEQCVYCSDERMFTNVALKHI